MFNKCTWSRKADSKQGKHKWSKNYSTPHGKIYAIYNYKRLIEKEVNFRLKEVNWKVVSYDKIIKYILHSETFHLCLSKLTLSCRSARCVIVGVCITHQQDNSSNVHEKKGTTGSVLIPIYMRKRWMTKIFCSRETFICPLLAVMESYYHEKHWGVK